MVRAVRLFVWVAFILAPVFITLPVARAQGNVLVTLLRPPPNQLRVADLWKVDLNNLTDRDFTIYLHGTADEETDGRIVDARSKTFRLLAHQRVRVTGAMLEPITVDQWNDRYKDVILRSGQVPTGSYRVCVEVLVAETDSLLGTDCYDQPVEIEQYTPPILVFPLDESTVVEKLPTFNWLPPSPVRQGDRMSYQLRIVEVLGRQTALDAMASNPAFFDLREITTNSFRFPVGARGFIVGSTYAWQIRAFLTQRYGDRVPLGESEIWWFTYGDAMHEQRDPTDEGQQDLPPGRNPTPPVRETDTDIQLTDVGGPQIRTRATVPVSKDLEIKPGLVPPGIDLDKRITAKPPVYTLSPMALRALMHTCQGAD
jgi:hypothetical protein